MAIEKKIERKQQQKQKEEEEEEEEEAPPIHGDILEAILSHVPLIFLLPACHVSKTWNRAAFSSLRFNTIKPWLIVHAQTTRPPYPTTAHAYDPSSHLWIEINHHQPFTSIHHHASPTLRSSDSTNLLYVLSPTKFSFSVDPLHLTWHHVDAPLVWRTDPVVELVGNKVIVAGGACDFEDDPLAVEMYDTETRTWEHKCESMPAILKDSAASTWLSTAVNENNINKTMYVMERASGVTHRFDPSTKTWNGPYDLRPDENENVYHSVIGFVNNRLILVGLIGDDAVDVKSVKMWEVDGEEMSVREMIGEMPDLLVKKLKGESYRVTSIGVNLMGDFVYIHNPSAPDEIVVCEMVNGVCQWGSVRNVVVNDRTRIMDTLVFTCSNVGLAELHKAFVYENRGFTVKEMQ